MVDSKYRFVWASCGYPGNSHDPIIFQSTDPWNRIKNQEYPPPPPQKKKKKKWQERGFPSCNSLDTWRCSIFLATVVDEAMHELKPCTTTKILQLPVEPSQYGDGGCCFKINRYVRRIKFDLDSTFAPGLNILHMIFVCIFGVNFCGENFGLNSFGWNIFLRIVENTAKIAKIRSRKRATWCSLNVFFFLSKLHS